MKKNRFSKATFLLCLIVSVGMMVGGFFVPPLGIIDGSIITGVGELLAFAAFAMVPSVISSAKSTKVTTRSGTTIEVKGKEPQPPKPVEPPIPD